MKSRKIRILDWLSDKIETGDSKKKVVHIRFGCPTKKNEFGWGIPWGGHGRAQAPCWPWEVAGEGREGEVGGEEKGIGWLWGEEGVPWGCCMGGARSVMLLCACEVLLAVPTSVRKKGGKREERRKGRKRKRRKRRKEI
jgi:hypothetical protein